jgi:hypothetical protein
MPDCVLLMPNPILIKRTATANLPSSLLGGELAWTQQLKLLSIGGMDGTIYPIAGEGFFASIPLNQFAPASAPIDINNQRITNLATTNLADTDAAPVKYVKDAVLGLDAKNSVRAASVGNINLDSPGTMLDGYAFGLGDRFLAKNQAIPTENGIYVWNGVGVPATRSEDFSFNANTVSSRAYVYVENGATYKGSGWTCSNSDPILETDPIIWVQFFGGAGVFATSPPLYLDGSVIKLATSSALFAIDASNSLIISGGVAGDFLTSGGSGNPATFAPLNLATANLQGALPVSNGGTGSTSFSPGILKTDGDSFMIAIPNTDYLTNNSPIDGGTY